jgi:hypothetical protein
MASQPTIDSCEGSSTRRLAATGIRFPRVPYTRSILLRAARSSSRSHDKPN